MRSRTSFLLLATAVAAASLAGCTATGADEPTRGAGQQGYPRVEGQLTRIGPGQRQSVPTVSGPALGSAGTVSTADYRGKVVVLNVWGSWCSPCREEAPALQAASEQTKDTAQFIGIDTKDFSPAAPQAFVRANKITYPSIFDPDGKTLLNLAGQTPPSAVPSTLIIDSEGRLAVRVLSTVSTITLVAMINDVAAGR